MAKTYIFGHRNPNTDTIPSAIIMADFEQQAGNSGATPYHLGEVSAKTGYALDHFEVDAPTLLNDDLEGQGAALVNHNEFQQGAETITKADIVNVIDHHRIANFETAGPLYYRIEPVSCAATTLYKMYRERNFKIKSGVTGLMISAIVSDNLLFKSPTCTGEDASAAKALKDIANVDLGEYGLEMLRAGASTTDESAEELLNMDAKSFDTRDYVTRIAQVNTVDIDEVLNRKDELEKAVLEISVNERYDLFVLVVTDIINSDSKILVVGAEKDKVDQTFNIQLGDGIAFLSGIVSCRKQVVPQITGILTK